MLQNEKFDLQNIADRLPVAVFIYKLQKGRVSVVYTNEYFRSVPLSSEIKIMSLDEEGLLQLIHPDDRRAAKDFFIALFHEMIPGEISYRSLFRKNTEYRWYHLSARPVSQPDGSVLAYVVFTDITAEKEIEIRALKNQQMYRLITEYSKQIIFEYDQENKRILYQMDNAYTRAICEASGMPAVVENVPDSLIDLVDEPYREKFRTLFEPVVDEHPKPAFEYSSVVQGKKHWWRVHSAPVTDHEGRVLTIYCCAQDITDMKLEQQRYLDFFQDLDKAYPNNLGSFHLNLTKNICLDGRSPLAFVREQKKSGTVDGYFYEFSKLLSDTETLAWFRRTFTREDLLRRFRKGESTVSFPYAMRYQEKICWRQAILVMNQNPRTKDVEAVTYAVDIDQQKRGRMIFQLISKSDSDFVGYIDLFSETFIMYSGNWHSKGLEAGQWASYHNCLELLMRCCTSSESAKRLLRQVSLKRIRDKLAQNGKYTVLYDFLEVDGRQLKKRLVFQWLDIKRGEILVIQADVTESWNDEQEWIRHNEETNALKDMVTNVPIGIMVLSHKGSERTLVAENRGIHDLLGEGYQSGNLFFTYVHPEDVAHCQEAFQHIGMKDSAVTVEFRFLHRQGAGYRWLRMVAKGSPKNEDERLLYCCLSDITDEKNIAFAQAEVQRLELQRYDTQIKMMAAANPNFAACYHLNITKDGCTNMVIQDDRYYGLKQLSASGTANGLFQATANTILDAGMAEKVRQTFNCAELLRKFERGETKVSMEYPCRSVRGGVRWILGLVNMVRNPESGDVEGITYAIDIDDRKKNELVSKRISEQEFEYIGILYLISEEMEFVQKKAHILYPEIGERIPYDDRRAFVEGRFIRAQERENYHQLTSLAQIQAALDQTEGYTVSYLYTDSQGRRSCQQMRFSWLDQVHHIVMIVQTDVTASYEHEEKQFAAIQNALMEAERASSAKSDFVSRISHDIRTPIGAIANITEFALEDLHDPEKLRNDLRKIQVSNDFLLSLINDVLDISKIDSGKVELHPEMFLYVDFSSNIRNMFEPLCEKKNLQFVLGEDPAVSAIRIDCVRFNQIAMNLISNAVKYTPAGGMVTVALHAEARRDGRWNCSLQVADTGIGMSKEFQKTMFEPFTQEETNPGRDKTMLGSGLGLSLVKKIVDLMNGSIAVKSALGQGTEIIVSFVAEAVDCAHEPMHIQSDPLTEKLTGKVLLAEDNEINTEIAKRILEAFGLEVTHAADGKKAAELFAASSPGQYQAILMDIQMPVMNGYDASKRIRALHRPDAAGIPIIAMTADAFSAAIEHSKSVGMTDYLTKPLDIKLLHDTLAKYIL